MDSQPAIYLQQETRTVLPKSTMQNGSSSEVNCKSHQFPVSKNHVSSACPNLVKVSEVDSNNTKQMGPSGVQEEFQPLEVETEQVLFSVHALIPTPISSMYNLPKRSTRTS